MNRTIKCPDCDRVKSRFNDNASVRYSKVYDERIPDSEIIKALAETCDPIEEYIENDESTLHIVSAVFRGIGQANCIHSMQQLCFIHTCLEK